jgi:hypothetical protein
MTQSDGKICIMSMVSVQIRNKDSQVKTQLVLWIFILFKETR